MGETEIKVVNIPMRLSTKKTNAQFERVIEEMTSQGWVLVHNSRIGSAGGALTFQREKSAG